MTTEQGFSILYKCNRCGVVSSVLELFCNNCGHRLILKPVLRAMQDEDTKRQKKMEAEDEL